MRSSSRIALLIVALGAAGLGIVHGGEEEPVRRPRAVPPAYSDSAVDAFTLIQPPTNDEYFPCSDCHIPEDEVNTTPRVLEEEHTDKVLVHGESSIWCLDCHDRQERDHLHAASGNPIEFGQSHKLCGQCHGRMYQEWKRGVHGKRLGNWSGPKEYLVCVSCHNPHSPQFKPLEPLPPPQRPEDHH
jgi:hypothetical protein